MQLGYCSCSRMQTLVSFLFEFLRSQSISYVGRRFRYIRAGYVINVFCDLLLNFQVAPYERPVLSKDYLISPAPARLPSFHCCAESGEERLTPEWYIENGIELMLGTRVISVDVTKKALLTATGETISYKYLIVATGARALKLEEFGVNGLEAANVCYLRDLADAEILVEVMQSCSGGNAVVIGGGYLGMECAASLVENKLNVTVVFPEAHFMARLFTSKIANYYEAFYQSKGVKFVKGTILTSFEFNSVGKVTAVNLRDGSKLPADMVVVAIGIRPNTGLLEGQLGMEKWGIKVNSKMQSSNTSVYAIGDVAAFPIKTLGETRRLEHADAARKSAMHAVSAIMEPEKTDEFDYLPVFYSRAFSLSWKFYGDNAGEALHFGDFTGQEQQQKPFGAYWINEGHLVGCFLEGGSREQHEAIAEATRCRVKIDSLNEVEREGLGLVLSFKKKYTSPGATDVCNYGVVLEKPLYAWHAAAGVLVAVSVAAVGYWYGRRRRRW